MGPVRSPMIRPLRLLLLLGIVAGATACGPIVMIPGGELSGAVQAAPSGGDWAFTDSVDDVQLETRPEDPYSVNVWCVSTGGALYIAAGGGLETAWAQHIAADPNVRLRVGENVYELKATRVDGPEPRDAFMDAAQRKYDFEPDPEDAAKAVLFRLDPR